MKIIKESAVLKTTNSKGGQKYWKIEVQADGPTHYLVQTYWNDTKTGTSVVQSTEPRLVLGKNIGKKNETTSEAQALAEMQSIITRQKDKGYREKGEEEKSLLLPMLAHDFNKRGKKLDYSVFIQPKYDGCRALYSNSTGFYSRLGKPFIPEVVEHLQFDTKDYLFDGELMLPPPYTFQDTITAIKKYRKETTPLLQYHIYDLVEPTMTFRKRRDSINNFFVYTKMPSSVIEVATLEAANADEVDLFHSQFIEQGYEGIMIRTPNGLYKADHRSADLLKLKDFIDAEYEIIKVSDSLGEPGKAIFTCITLDSKEFNVRPRGTVEYRQALFNVKDTLLGKMLTVRYQNLTDAQVPRFPVGLTVRDYE